MHTKDASQGCFSRMLNIRPRFALRTVLIAVTVFNLLLGYVVIQAQKQMAAVNLITSLGGRVYYEHQIHKTGTKLAIPTRTFKSSDGSIAIIAGPITVGDELSSYRLADSVKLRHPLPGWARSAIIDHMFTTVVAVHLEDTKFADDHAWCLADLPNLRVLSLSRSSIRDAGLAHLSELERLERLSIDGTKITGNGLVHLSKLVRLKQLGLQGCNLDDEGMRDLSLPPNLETLALDDTEIGDDGLACLETTSRLELLSLNHTRVSGPGLRYLSQQPLKVLLLAYTPIKLEGISNLAQCTSLQKLSLGHTPINDDALGELGKMHFLQKLELPWVDHRTTHISASAARQIEKTLANTEISYPP